MLPGELLASRRLFAKHMAAAAQERASRHLEARSYERRQAIPQHIGMMLQHVVTTERRCFNAYLPEHQRPRQDA